MKTVDDFIKELQDIPEGRKKLPLIIFTPNGEPSDDHLVLISLKR